MEIIVIGGGPAGVTAALRARELGAKVTLIERNQMGGTCTNDGCVPTRVLAKAARLWRDAAQLAEYGLETDAPKLDFEKLLKRAQQVVYTIHEKKQLIGHLQDSGVETIVGLGEVKFINSHTVALPDGREFQADKFILCAGGRARRLDFPGAEFSITHSELWSLKKLPQSITIVGGAATGCQVASIFNTLGVPVTILDISKSLLPIEDRELSIVIEDGFMRRGIQLINGISSVERIEPMGSALRLYYSMNGQQLYVESQAILLSTGWLGNLDGLNLRAAGVETIRNYVKVDDYLRSSAEHIYAAGDITGRMMLVQSAGYEAIVAVENAILGNGTIQKHSIVPHGGFTDPEYGSVGLTEIQARNQGEIIVATISYSEIDRAVIDDRTEGLCKLIVSQDTHRILGAHVVGEQALEIVHIVATAMIGDMWIEQLAEMEIAYPTFTAIIGLAAREIVRKLGVLPLSPAWRNLGQPAGTEWERRDRKD